MGNVRVILLSFFSFLLFTANIYATQVDLSTFSADPNDASIVDIGSDTITFYENIDYGYIYAADDAFMVADDATELTFDYELSPGVDDWDWLVAIFDYNYAMEIEQSGTGSWSIDMTPYQGQTISLAFGLEFDFDNDWGYDSVGTISNLNMAVSSASVPEPSTFVLFGLGILGLAKVGRKKQV